MGRPVVHFEITTTGDATALQQFYRELFEWDIDASNPMNYGVVRTNAGTGIDGGISGADGDTARVTVYISVPAIDPVLAQLEEKGGKTLMPRTELPGMITLAHFADPHGNVIGLVEDMVPAAE